MARLDDLTAELEAALQQPAANFPAEIRQRLKEAWDEGQLSMRVRTSTAALAGDKDSKAVRTAAAEVRVTDAMLAEGKDPLSPIFTAEYQSRVQTEEGNHLKWVCLGVPLTEEFQ